jgi:hypothetical protein
MASPQLSARFSLIVPVALAGVEAELRVGAVRMVAKKEHHLTVFGFSVGKVLRKAIEVRPGLGAEVDALASSFDWGIALVPRFVHLARPEKGGTLQTAIVRATARVDAFYGEVRSLLQAGAAEEGLHDLDTVLRSPPPPHVTLYTTDPEGLAGIGLNTHAELEEALARGAAAETGALAAYPLGPGVVPVPTLA